MKICKKCGSQFDTPRCKTCRAAISARWYVSNRKKVISAARSWRSANPQAASKSAKKSRQVHRDTLLVKKRKYNARYYAKDPIKQRERVKQWRLNNPELAALHKKRKRTRCGSGYGRISKGLLEKLFKLQNGKCPCCGQRLGKHYHIDHIVPLSRGGKNVDSNIQLMTAECNMKKHAKNPLAFMQERGFLL